MIGPSPRGWGKRNSGNAQIYVTRAIPTRVGKTSNRTLVTPALPGHPHAGGENETRVHCAGVYRGPSPRGWGKPTLISQAEVPFRAIPTRVGKTSRETGRRCAVAGHPHAGGENGVNSPTADRSIGPSPRGWGKHSHPLWHGDLHRAIPTRVGKTASTMSANARSAGHPHAGGENGGSSTDMAILDGPSPRGWGKQNAQRVPVVDSRAIPTRVGKTGWGKDTGPTRAGHPHAGGENNTSRCLGHLPSGPSPRGWGKRERTSANPRFNRAIPTRVGKTEFSTRT